MLEQKHQIKPKFMHDVDGNLHFISTLWTWHEPLSLSQPVGEFGFYLMILVLTCII